MLLYAGQLFGLVFQISHQEDHYVAESSPSGSIGVPIFARLIAHCARVLILNNMQSFIRIILSQVHHPNYNPINHLIIDNRNDPMGVTHNICIHSFRIADGIR